MTECSEPAHEEKHANGVEACNLSRTTVKETLVREELGKAKKEEKRKKCSKRQATTKAIHKRKDA